MTREKADEEFRLEAMWSYRANPPMRGKGDNAQAVPFDKWMDSMMGGNKGKAEPAEISDREMEQLIRQGHVR